MKRYDIICMGVMVVDTMVRYADGSFLDRDTTEVDDISISTGGDALNQSITLARLRAPVAAMGLVGRDRFGNIIIEALEREGIDSSLVARSDVKTGASVVIVEPNGERRFLYQAGGNRRFSKEHIDFEAVRKARIISIASLCGLTGFENDGLNDVIKIARESGVTTVADFSGIDIDMPKMRSLISQIDWIMPSYKEASSLTGERDVDDIASALDKMGAKNFVIKLGADGCLVCSKGERTRVSSFPASVVDTTGAGDNFVAGFIYGLNQGWEADVCAKFGCAAGSLAVECAGATGGVKSLEQVMLRAGMKR